MRLNGVLVSTTWRAWLLLAVGALMYFVVIIAAADSSLGGVALGSFALATFGAVLASFVVTRLGVSPVTRLGGRAQKVRQRYLALAVSSVVAVYAVLVFGGFVTTMSALRDCLALPLCPARSDLATLTIVHRGAAGLATLLVLALALQTWRTQSARVLRLAAGWSLGLMALQNIVGLVHVTLADDATWMSITRPAHGALGAASFAALVVLATLAVRLPWSGVKGQESGIEDQGAAARSPQPAALNPQLSVLKDYISLTKPGVITLLIFTTLIGMLITPAGWPRWQLVFWTMLAGWLMPAGAHALNCYFDRDIDIRMGRTGKRPLPSNRIPAWHAAALGIALAAIAFTLFVVFVNWAAALLAFAGFVYYVFIYTLWLKRTTMSNIVIGGAAGAFPPLVGWAAATGSLTWASLFLFLIIFYWTPPHFWALALIRQKDYANAGVPMLPVVAGDDETKHQIVLYSVMMVALTLLLTPLHVLGLVYLVLAVILGGLFLRYALRLRREGTTVAAWSLYKFSLLYLFLLFAAMVVDRLAA